jgi:hypothetical protein
VSIRAASLHTERFTRLHPLDIWGPRDFRWFNGTQEPRGLPAPGGRCCLCVEIGTPMDSGCVDWAGSHAPMSQWSSDLEYKFASRRRHSTPFFLLQLSLPIWLRSCVVSVLVSLTADRALTEGRKRLLIFALRFFTSELAHVRTPLCRLFYCTI